MSVMSFEIPTRVKVPRELRARDLSVRDAKRLPGGFVRVTLGGDELEGFESTGPSDHCKLFVPAADGEMTGRHYTPLHVGGGEIAFDIVVHGDGPVSAWADSLPVGSPVRVGGPRSSLEFPVGASQLVLIGDASAFPPIRRWLAARPQTLPTTLILHGEGIEYFEDLDGVDVVRTPFDPSGDGIVKALSELELDGGTYVWAAGEAGTLIAARRWLRNESPVAREAVKVDGYWKQGLADRDHHAPIDPNDAE
ncbi:siderophore-interacting protein [Flaviflexus ciconiae]|uniref:Siderophore-interacting protein n=2 Tax=Flaviflexus ciconiae TaxID=2496867 RepID=A0A3S9PW81_9ACTO|nr:siderophore-interacting protein [Flaviflexus ciconiae]